ncbi:VCBS domain-containing protein [uncultured Pseudodesulfovibrio sp.]|uniref:VCBS domain-containing protein n=1 Tax=uncultured Pseudodesulfovibrio sp. TaxID=2035858 RepID=UPI0029C89A35|nr:VCBS domain-containing protein [uncultured Pseudodesulfovibrio sp.]
MTDTSTTQSPIIQVSLPGAGRSVTYRLTADALVRFTFDLAEAEFIGNGNNLEIIVEGGGTIILEDYLVLAEANTLPTFEMLDGQQVEGGVYLFAFESDQAVTEQDIETAAGAGTTGSGAGEYTDDAGNLFDGLTALGGQGDAYDGYVYPTLDPVVTDLPEEGPIPPVAVDDVNRIVESGWNRDEGENGHYEQEGPFGSVTGNLLLNDYDDDNIDYPETAGSQTELSVQTIDFPGEDFTGNNPGPAEVSDSGTQVNGQYGTLTVYADGSYEYVLDETLADPLRQGQEVIEQFEYTAVDPDGNGSNTATLTITLVGTNDAPDALDDLSADVIEQGTEVAGIAIVAGNVLHNDSDIDNIGYEDLDPAYRNLLPTDPDGLVELGVTSIYSYGTSQYAGTPDGDGNFVVEGTYGTLTINSDGSYEYVLDQTKADPLNIGDDPIEFFSYAMWDGEKYDYAYLRVPVLGSNDAPVADADVNSFTEAVDDAAADDVMGNILTNDTDIDNTALELSVSSILYSGDATPPVRVSDAYTADHVIEGEFGTLYLNNDGSYHYVEDKNATDPLNSDDPAVTDVFTYEVTDNQAGGALTDTATLTITIGGANDTPVASVDVNSFTEAVDDAAAGDVMGNILTNDTDIDNTGLELTVSDIEYSGAGTPPVRVSDAYTADHVIEGQFGTLYLNNDGSYHYVEDKNATDPLNSDDPAVTDVFTYEVSDNQAGGALTDTATLTITIGGANDTPVASVDVNSFTEAVDSAAAGDVMGNILTNDTDIDNTALELSVSSILYSGDATPPVRVSDAYTADHVIEGEFGTLYLNNDGSYHYVEDKNATDPLNSDDPAVTDVFTYVVSDNQTGGALTDTATLTITIGGANDSPIASVDVNSFTEAVDTATAHAVSGNVLDNDTDVDNVDLGDLGTPELTVDSITYSGSGTPPARTSDLYDADHIVEGEYGTLYLNDDGSYVYVEDKNATDPLNSDDPAVTDVFTYEVTDNQAGGALTDTATLTITISGANDSPVATLDVNSFTEAVDDAAAGDVMGNILTNDTDIDNTALELSVASILYSGDATPPVRVSDAYTADHVIEGEFGTLYLNNDGSYHYVEDKNATDPLNSDDPAVTDVFTYVVSDNQTGGALTDTATLTITIGGANDSPTASVDVNSFTEAVDDAAAGDVIGNILSNDGDIDNPGLELTVSDIEYSGAGTPPVRVSDAYTADHVIEGEYGTLYLNNDGSYHYVEDKSATDWLNSDDPAVTDVFTYEVSDNQTGGALSDTATLTITISGANDSPVATLDVNSFTEAVDDTTAGDVMGNILTNDTDIDNTALELSVNDILYSGAGTPPVRVSDAYTADNIVEGEYGTLYLNNDGSYHYVEDKNATDWLNSDDPAVTDVFTYEVSDNQAGGALSDTATLTITISGANDSPVATVDLNAFTEAVDDAAPADVTGNILTNDTDIDNTALELSVHDILYTGGGTPPVRVSDAYTADHVIEGEYGTLYLNNDGSYHYVEDKSATDWLNSDDPAVTDVFTYEVSDNQAGVALTDTATLTITISGANDTPVASVDVNSFTEAVDDAAAGDVMGNVLTNDTDVDNTAGELSVTSIEYSGDGTPPVRVSDAYTADHVIEGEFGTLYLNNDGSYHYVEDKDVTDPLNVGDDPVSDVFTYEVSDNQTGGALSDTATLTITIDPANDSPIAVHDGSHEIFITNTVETVIDDWSGVSGSVIYGPGYTVTAESFDANDNPISDVSFTTWGNDQHLGIYTNGSSDDQKVDDKDGHEQITFEFDDPQSSFSIEFIAQGNNHVNAWVYPVGGGDPVMFANVGNAVYITPGFEFDTIVFIPDGAFGMESLTTVTGGENLLTGTAEGNVLANDYDVDNATFDDAAASGDMSTMELSVSDIDSSNVPGNAPSAGTDLDGNYYTVDGEFGSLKIYETGEWSYTPSEEVDGEGGWQNLDHSATDVFVYTVSDGLGGTDTASIEVSLNVNTTSASGGSGTLSGTAGNDVLFPTDGDTVSSGAGNDAIVIDPTYLGDGATTVNVTDFSDHDHLVLGNMEGAHVSITSNSNDVSLVFSDIDGSDDITVNLLGVAPVQDAVDQTVELTTSDDLNQLIQTIIDSGNDSML